MTDEERKFIEWHFEVINRNAVQLGDNDLIRKVTDMKLLIENGNLEAARLAVPDLNYTDFQIEVYLVIAGLSREERDIKMLRKMASDQIIMFGSVMTGLLIFIARLSGNDFDIKRVRRVIEKNNSFAQTQEYIILYRDFKRKEDLDSARKSAQIEDINFPYFRPANLTIVAGFTGLLEDYTKMEGALNGIDELALRKSIPSDLDLDGIISRSVTFLSAVDAVAHIHDEDVRSRVWTLIGINIRKTFTTVVIV